MLFLMCVVFVRFSMMLSNLPQFFLWRTDGLYSQACECFVNLSKGL